MAEFDYTPKNEVWLRMFFNWLNQRCFAGKLPQPIIRICDTTEASELYQAVAHSAGEAYFSTLDDVEIIFTEGQWGYPMVHDVLHSMLHEMCHFYLWLLGKDWGEESAEKLRCWIMDRHEALYEELIRSPLGHLGKVLSAREVYNDY